MTVKIYKLKPQTIKAVQWTGDNKEEIEEFTKNSTTQTLVLPERPDVLVVYPIALGKAFVLDIGDYLITDKYDCVLPCRLNIFLENYEESE